MRFKNSLFNSIIAATTYIIIYIFSFLNRAIFVRYLSADYLGVNSLFAEMISVLSLTELGIGTSIVYMMYKPLCENDITQIRKLMGYYRKSYLIVEIVMSLLAIIMLPILKSIIKGIFIKENVFFIYFLFVFHNISSYFFAYKKSILVADQKIGITSIIDAFFKVIQYIIQCIVLIARHDYIAYLLVPIIMQITNNVVVTIYVNRKYPQYKKCNGQLGDNEKKEIRTNIKAMFLNRIGGKVIYSTDSIVLSVCINTLVVGYYSNYQLIFFAGLSLIEKPFSGAIASIGNFSIKKSKVEARHLFELMNFIAFWVISLMDILIYLLIDDFICLCFGNEYVLDKSIKTALCIYFYLNAMRRPALLFWEALGLFRYFKYKPLIESSINLFVSVILAKKVGLIGVILGSICSIVLTSVWVDPLIVCRYGISMNFEKYLKRYVKYMITFLIVMFLTENAFRALHVYVSVASMVIKGILGAIIIIICYVFIYRKSPYIFEIKSRFNRK